MASHCSPKCKRAEHRGPAPASAGNYPAGAVQQLPAVKASPIITLPAPPRNSRPAGKVHRPQCMCSLMPDPMVEGAQGSSCVDTPPTLVNACCCIRPQETNTCKSAPRASLAIKPLGAQLLPHSHPSALQNPAPLLRHGNAPLACMRQCCCTSTQTMLVCLPGQAPILTCPHA